MACAKAGAAVTHVDAYPKGMVSWAKENAAASGLRRCSDPISGG